MTRKLLWGEERVTVQLVDGTYRSFPAGWTDAVAADPYIGIGGGRSLFRVEDLMELSRMVAGAMG